MSNLVIIVASFTQESGKRKICDCIIGEMICFQMISCGISILQLTFSIYNHKVLSSVPFWLQQRSSIFVFVYIMEFLNFNYGQENTFTLSPFRSWKMDVTIIQVSKNFNTHHNFSFSCQEVRFLLIILLALFIFLSDV